MRREVGFEAIEADPNSVVTVGTFDGVHRGHRAIVDYLVRRSEEVGGLSTVVTFDPHPREVVRGEQVPLLTTVEERGDIMEALGLERFVVIPFTETFSQLDAETYVRAVLADEVGMREIVVGHDHGFGKGRSGGRDLLMRLGDELGFSVDVIPAQDVDDEVVSSSLVRKVLADEGDVARAATLLGQRYAFSGSVVRGDGRGRTIGYPTANVEPQDARKLLPANGVYAVLVEGEEIGQAGGMMNVGVRPTFDGESRHAEVHLFDIDRDLYGQTLRVEFIMRVRDEQRFAGVDELKRQLSRDEDRCRGALAEVC